MTRGSGSIATPRWPLAPPSPPRGGAPREEGPAKFAHAMRSTRPVTTINAMNGFARRLLCPMGPRRPSWNTMPASSTRPPDTRTASWNAASRVPFAWASSAPGPSRAMTCTHQWSTDDKGWPPDELPRLGGERHVDLRRSFEQRADEVAREHTHDGDHVPVESQGFAQDAGSRAKRLSQSEWVITATGGAFG